MEKFNREINELKMNTSKERIIENVLSEIEEKPKSCFSFKKPLIMILSLSLVIAIALSSDTITNIVTPDNPIVIPSDPVKETVYNYSDDSIEKLRDITYLSSNLISSNFDLNNTNSIKYLSSSDETEFEGTIDDFNYYFSVLNVYLGDDTFQSSELLDSDLEEFTFLLSFTQNDSEYRFYINVFDDGSVEGELHLHEDIYEVSGSIVETDDELEIKIKATEQDNYIELEYKTERSNTTEVKYTIKTFTNGEFQERYVKFEKEENDSKIEIHEGNDYYILKKEIDDGEEIYKLQYQINNKEGSVKIRENQDVNGNVTYDYEITENGNTKSITKGNNGRGNNSNKNNREIII